MDIETIEEIEKEEQEEQNTNPPHKEQRKDYREEIKIAINIILGIIKLFIIYLFSKGNNIQEESNIIINNLSYISGIIICIALDIIVNLIVIRINNKYKYYELIIFSIIVTILISVIMLLFK